MEFITLPFEVLKALYIYLSKNLHNLIFDFIFNTILASIHSCAIYAYKKLKALYK